jgi:5-methylcytosine-specific restriction endonuclease McrA
MNGVLVLNATYEPLSIVSVRRAIILLLKEKAELIEAAEERLHAARVSLPVPLVIRLVYYVRIPRQVAIAPSRSSVLLRDNYTCQYCGAAPGRANLTLDHVVPRSRGGQTAWDNLVTACRRCNMRKGDHTPEEVGMALRKRPGRPHYLAFLLLGRAGPQDAWNKYVFLGSDDGQERGNGNNQTR